MCFEGRKIRSGFPSLFCFNFFGWLRRRKRAAKKIIATAGRLTGGSFQRLIENSPQHGKRLKRKIPRRQAGWREISGNTESPPQHPQHRACRSSTCLLLVAPHLAWSGGIFRQKSPHKENARSGGVDWRKSSEAGGGSHQAAFKTRCKFSSN